MATFPNMKRWSDARLDKELAFASPDSPDALERDWAVAVHAEALNREMAAARRAA